MKSYLASFLLITTLLILSGCQKSGPHLFLLSGQSNMAGLDPEISFIPTVTEAFGAENVIVVKDAQGGQPIRRWDKQWVATEGQNEKQIGDLYDKLMTKTNEAIGENSVQSVTFVWMQGERDAREQLSDLYLDSFNRVIGQLKTDLGHDQINVVIGRLSDFDMKNET